MAQGQNDHPVATLPSLASTRSDSRPSAKTSNLSISPDDIAKEEWIGSRSPGSCDRELYPTIGSRLLCLNWHEPILTLS